jgi:pyroglutamyl-peptidase
MAAATTSRPAKAPKTAKAAHAKRPSTPPTVLLTGFAPFGGEDVNPSWEAVRALQGARIGGHRIEARCLPVVFGGSLAALRRAISDTRPVLVVCVGQAGGRAALSLERVAINVDDARIPDNAGARPVDAAIAARGPAAYFSTLPLKRLRRDLERAGIPVEISQTAGTFVCNHVFYGLMHALRRQRGLRGGFVHIPYSPEQVAGRAGVPSLPVGTVAMALRRIVRIALKHADDLPIAGGATH